MANPVKTVQERKTSFSCADVTAWPLHPARLVFRALALAPCPPGARTSNPLKPPRVEGHEWKDEECLPAGRAAQKGPVSALLANSMQDTPVSARTVLPPPKPAASRQPDTMSAPLPVLRAPARKTAPGAGSVPSNCSRQAVQAESFRQAS